MPKSALRSRLILLAVLSASFACIRRTAPPPTSAAAGAGASAAPEAPKVDAALEAANARIAGVQRADLIGGAGSGAFQVHGDVQKVELTTIKVEGQPFTEALRANIKEGSGHEWAVQMTALTTAPVEEGDALLATFYLRAEKPQEGSGAETEFVFELAGSPYTKSIQYPVQASADWSKVQVRFKASRAYAAGEANMIFRLGYEPEIIQVGGVKVENFGKRLPVSGLPSTQGADRRRAKAVAAAAAEADAKAAAGGTVEGGDLALDVDPGEVVRKISPYVYGINSQGGEGIGVTVRRMGGNRQTAYNWENNASNAGSDYNHSSDDWPCTSLGYHNCNEPGAQFVDFALANKKAGWESLATIPLVDYVTADKRGSVHENEKAPSPRWNHSFAQKPGGKYTLTPDLADGNVYQDEFVNFLVQKLGKAAQGGIKFYALDNEPALWPSTHPRVHPDKTRYDEMVARTEATASAITKIDPTAVVLGAVAFGWSEYLSLSDAPDAKVNNDKYGTYLDFYLASMKRLEEKYKRRLVHVLDVHWYPEARGAKRITDKDNSPKTVAARLQAVRSLWDPTYSEKSWIADTWGKPIRLIPWLRERIAERYPGTELAMTEYDYGGTDHVSGGLAQVDLLGVLGREGMAIANYWGNGPGNGNLPKYIAAAFKLYRNYDGKGGTYGDTAVVATPADNAKASLFAAKDSKHPGQLTIVVVNKELRTAYSGKINIKSGTYTKAQVFTLDGSSTDVHALPPVDIAGNQISYRLPPLSATLFVCEGK